MISDNHTPLEIAIVNDSGYAILTKKIYRIDIYNKIKELSKEDSNYLFYEKYFEKQHDEKLLELFYPNWRIINVGTRSSK